MKSKKKIMLVSSAAVFFMLIALACLVMLLLFDHIVDTKISESIKLKNGSKAFKSWQTKSYPSKFAVYLYNLTNPDRVLAGERPNLTVIGPYVYWKEEEKLNISWTSVDDSPAISYFKRSIYMFDPKLSSGNPLSDRIISANLPILAISAANNAGRGPGAATIEMIKLFTSPKIFTKQSVHGFLWGYEDMTLSLCKIFFPEICRNDRVGLLSTSNNTVKGPYTIDSGIRNSTNTGSFIIINGRRSLNIWSTEKANAIHGTGKIQFDNTLNQTLDGFRLVRGIQLSDPREIFVTLLCQRITLNATNISHPKSFDELEVVEMELDTDSRTSYCPLKASGPACPPKGYFDISQCAVSGDVSPPVFASLPHHLDNAPDNAFAICNIDPFRDKFRLLVEPKTGIVVEAHVRLQVSVHLHRSPHMTDIFMNISDPIFLPMAWFENDMEGSVEDLKMLHDALYVSPMRMRLVLLILLIASLIIFALLVIDLAITIKARNSKPTRCCQWLVQKNSIRPESSSVDSADDLLTKNSDTMSSTISPWSSSMHNKSENGNANEIYS